MAQIGFNGFELGAEGPVKFADGSFIINYMYSFLSLLEAMGVSFGFSGVPKYQDLSFKNDYNLGDNHRLSITGLWGTSAMDNLESKEEDVVTGDFDTKVRTELMAIAVNLQSIFSDKIYGNLTVGICSEAFNTEDDSLTVGPGHEVISTDKWYTADSRESFADVKYMLNYTPEPSQTFSAGFTSRYRFYNLKDDRYTVDNNEGAIYHLRADGDAMQYLGFLNWNWRINNDLNVVLGVHSQYFALPEKTSVEPRASLSWSFTPKQRLTLGLGVHSQSLPLGTYYLDEQNRNLDFIRAVHYVTGYTLTLAEDSYIKLEGYFKDISKAPVETTPSTFSFLNAGANFGSAFGEDSMVSKGLGRTYGAELSFIKNFTEGYYITAALSFVRQEFKASDGEWRWGAFDNRFILNLLAGYEWVLSNNITIEFSGKYTFAGGAPYIPYDVERSKLENDGCRDYSRAYSVRKPNYSRLDFKTDFRLNFNGWSLISFVSVQNLLNTDNVLKYSWDKTEQRVKEKYQQGIYPMGGIKIEF